jgi:hypothetical protein
MQVQAASAAKLHTAAGRPDEAMGEEMPACLREELPAFACGAVSTAEAPWWLLAAMAQAQQPSETVW